MRNGEVAKVRFGLVRLEIHAATAFLTVENSINKAEKGRTEDKGCANKPLS
jgi:hypothetical protein